MRVSEFYNEVSEDLGFDYNPGPIFYVELAKLYGLLDEVPYCTYLVHCLSYQLVCHDDNGICLKVMDLEAITRVKAIFSSLR